MNIIVLGGGDSPERDISLKSAAAVAEALRKAGYDVTEIDPKEGLEGLDRLGKEAIIFPILHGEGGEDGKLQAELERRGLPYLGTQSKASSLCFDKGLTREKLKQAGISVAEGDLVGEDTYWLHDLIKRPHVLKVAQGGSSIGTYIVRDPSSIDRSKVNEVFTLNSAAVIEELIEGPEITVPILDRSALPVIEIRPPQDQEFDYENKYNGQSREICPPESIDPDIQTRAQQLAEKVHNTLGARHLSRVDMMIHPDGRLIVLELNTIPGLTNQSLYPKSAAVSGIEMAELMKRFVGLVSRDYNIK